jgi:GNAT superfamily N-acetyltransferase
MTGDGIRTRKANATDAAAVAAFYREAYTPEGGGRAEENYPFPQLLDPCSLAREIQRPELCWVVAEGGGHALGAVAAARNVGGERDRVAEFFGLVVGKAWRGRGLARRMIDAACEMLLPDASLLLAETRTADPGGWRAFRRCGFRLLGFEPFAHQTPAGSESMILLGRYGESPRGAEPNAPSGVVASLAEVILGGGPGTAAGVVESALPGGAAAPLRLTEAPGLAAQLEETWHRRLEEHPGVVGLRRLEGVDSHGSRCVGLRLVGMRHETPVSCARVAVDRVDHRARVLGLFAADGNIEAQMLGQVVDLLREKGASNAFTLAVDLRADARALHSELEQRGFFPTVYYPRLLGIADGRIDAVQFTWIGSRAFQESLDSIRKLDWPAAWAVVERVTKLAGDAHQCR